MGQKKEIRLEDIALELGISTVSVSNALNNKKGVGKELRDKVKKKAEEIGYQIPKTATKKETKTFSIGVMIAERYVKEFPSFYMDVYRQIAQVAAKKGSFTLLEVVAPEKEELRYRSEFFSNMKVDGIAFVGEMDRKFIQEVRKSKNVPVVGVDFYDLNEKMDYIVTDGLHGMQCVTQKLIDAGHRNIVFVGNPYATKSIMDRYMGYCKALKINGIEESAERIIYDRSEEWQNGMIEFELPEDLPDAFAVNCDKSAYYLIEKLQKKGIRVPEDVSVVGFDHLGESALENLELTTYENDKKALAQICLHILVKKMERKSDSDFVLEGVQIVDGQLIEGNTVKNRKERRRRNG